MTMRSYDDVDFRPWYLPDTARWLKLSLGARGLVAELLRKFDRHGRLALGDDPAADLAIILRLDEPETRAAFDELLAAGRVVWDGATRTLSDPDLPTRLRQGSAARMAAKRARDKASGVTPVTPGPDHVTSRHTRHSQSPSDLICSDLICSDLSESGSRSEDPSSSPRAIDEPANDTAPAAFWDGAIATVSAEVLGGKPIPNPTGLWFEYLAARSRKRWAMNHRDAVGWLSSVAPKRIREAEGGGFARASGGDTPGGSRWGPPTLKPGGDS